MARETKALLLRSGWWVTAPFARCFCIFRFLGELSAAVFFPLKLFLQRSADTWLAESRAAGGHCLSKADALFIARLAILPLAHLPSPQQPLFCVIRSAILLISSRRFTLQEQSKCSIFLSHSRWKSWIHRAGSDANCDKRTRCYCLQIRNVNLFLTLRWSVSVCIF